jgi:hypothetical protein
MLDGPQKELPVVGAFDQFGAVGARDGDVLKIRLAARGSDAAAVRASVAQVDAHVKECVEHFTGIKGLVLLDMGLALLRTVRADTTSDGTTATLTAELKSSPAAILALPELEEDVPEEADESAPHPRLRQQQDKPRPPADPQ